MEGIKTKMLNQLNSVIKRGRQITDNRKKILNSIFGNLILFIFLRNQIYRCSEICYKSILVLFNVSKQINTGWYYYLPQYQIISSAGRMFLL